MAEHPALDSIEPVRAKDKPRPETVSLLEKLEALDPVARELADRLKLERPLVFVDLETTGTFPQSDRIVQIAALKLYPSGQTRLCAQMVNPGIAIPPEATEIHGITDEIVADKPRFEQIAPNVLSFFAGCDVAGYGIARFDVPLLQEELKRAGLECLVDLRVVDSLRIYHEREPRNLEAALRFYCDRVIDGAHDAGVDTLSAFEVLLGQLNRYPDLSTDLDELDRVSMRANPSAFDREGRLVWRTDKLVLNFGKHRGQALEDVIETDRGYAEWVLRSDLSGEVKGAIRQIVKGLPPRRTPGTQ